jgi:hypothetical protein
MLAWILILASLWAAPAGAAGWPLRCATCERDSRGSIKRSRAAVAAFRRANPQPVDAHGKKQPAVVDHIIPIACATSPADQARLDRPWNMQWQLIAAAKAKDAWEMQLCDLATRAIVARQHRQPLPCESKSGAQRWSDCLNR